MEFILSFIMLAALIKLTLLMKKETEIMEKKLQGHYPTAEEARQAIKDADNHEGWG